MSPYKRAALCVVIGAVLAGIALALARGSPVPLVIFAALAWGAVRA